MRTGDTVPAIRPHASRSPSLFRSFGLEIVPCGGAESGHLGRGQFPPGAGGQIAEGQRPDGPPHQTFHLQPHRPAQSPHLALAPLPQPEFETAAVPPPVEQADLARPQQLVLVADARQQTRPVRPRELDRKSVV